MDSELTEEQIALLRSRARYSVSAEVFGKHNKLKKFVAPVHSKTAEQEEQIKGIVAKCFLFGGVGESDLDTLVQAFKFSEARPKEVIIRQGDEGTKLFLIAEGTAECWKHMEPNGKEVLLCSRGPGEYFGELALLYNAPRAATVIANTDMKMWTLDRDTFNRVVKAGVIARRQKYDDLLKKVSLFSALDPYDRCRLADALKEVVVENEAIVTEGQSGDCMYMILEGRAQAQCQGKVVKDYGAGDYFGEIGLISKKPRATTVVALGKCRLVMLKRESCVDLLGPMEQILQKNMTEYRKVLAQLSIDKKI